MIYFIACFCGLFAQRADHIICFIAIHFHDRNIETPDDLFDIGNSGQNIFRCFLAVGFIVCKIGMPFGWGMRIKTNSHMGGLLFVDQVNQGIGKPKLGIGVSSF